jgi:hypothetical protein
MKTRVIGKSLNGLRSRGSAILGKFSDRKGIEPKNPLSINVPGFCRVRNPENKRIIG